MKSVIEKIANVAEKNKHQSMVDICNAVFMSDDIGLLARWTQVQKGYEIEIVDLEGSYADRS